MGPVTQPVLTAICEVYASITVSVQKQEVHRRVKLCILLRCASFTRCDEGGPYLIWAELCLHLCTSSTLLLLWPNELRELYQSIAMGSMGIDQGVFRVDLSPRASFRLSFNLPDASKLNPWLSRFVLHTLTHFMLSFLLCRPDITLICIVKYTVLSSPCVVLSLILIGATNRLNVGSIGHLSIYCKMKQKSCSNVTEKSFLSDIVAFVESVLPELGLAWVPTPRSAPFSHKATDKVRR